MAKSVSLQNTRRSGIPPLKNSKGTWATTAEGKCELLLETLTGKYRLAREETNEYTDLGEETGHQVTSFLPVRARLVKRHLQELKEDKATGPDLLSAKLLKKCAGELAVPVAKLTRRIARSTPQPEGAVNYTPR